MTVQKLGHSCLLIKHAGQTVLTDPGEWSINTEKLQGVDLILISHKHIDHLRFDYLKKIIENNPGAIIVTNSDVGEVLTEAHIPFQLVEEKNEVHVRGVPIKTYNAPHENIYHDIEPVENTSFLIDDQLFFPGDSLVVPEEQVKALALPVIAPWLTLEKALDYALTIKPRIVFPIHDGMLKSADWLYAHLARVLPQHDIEFRVATADQMLEI